MARTPVIATDPNWVCFEDVDDVPTTSLQALMETAPFEEPKLSTEEMLPVMDAAVAALDILTERKRWIIYARIWRRMSVRQVGVELNLSKTHVDRLFKEALKELAAELRENGTASDWERLLGTVEL